MMYVVQKCKSESQCRNIYFEKHSTFHSYFTSEIEAVEESSPLVT
jgi:hypothetical protein